MFTDQELELMESILTECGPDWVESSVDGRLLVSVLEKIEAQLNG